MSLRASAYAMAVLLTAGLSLRRGRRPAWSDLPWVLDPDGAGGRRASLVVMGDPPDLTPANAMATKAAKGRFVYETLYQRAQQTQAECSPCCPRAGSSTARTTS